MLLDLTLNTHGLLEICHLGRGVLETTCHVQRRDIDHLVEQEITRLITTGSRNLGIQIIDAIRIGCRIGTILPRGADRVIDTP